ncbi:MAG: methylated-DNA--[protein]-cysteine S-methyltransferase [Planctomycetota bacterium]
MPAAEGYPCPSPVGTWLIVPGRTGIARLRFTRRRMRPSGPVPALVRRCMRELSAHFAGRLPAFTVPLDLTGLTPFRRRVLVALRRVPRGRTIAYSELARRAGCPGGAVGANPLPVIIPCHRVIAAGGRPGGFGLGLPLKRRLPALEGVRL